jgi:hypothetical protein
MISKLLSKVGYESLLYLKRNQATVLTCIGAIGVVATTVTAIKATPKAMKLINKMDEYSTTVDKIKVVLPVYIPSIFMGAGTIMCIFGANALNTKQQASLTSAYTLINSYHNTYRNKLIDLYGKEADEKIRNEIVRENCGYHQIGVDTPDGKFIFYDEISGRSIERYEREIMDAEYHFNRNFAMRGYASLNEFYEFLGLPQTDYGDSLGWSISDGYSWVDFEHRLISTDDGGIPIYSIDMVFPPEAEYMRDWE